MTKILLTGATGFVGGHLAEALAERGDTVRCLVRPGSPAPYLEPLSVEIIRGELDDAAVVRDALRGVDTVFHVAGALAERRRGELHRVNVELTANLAEACSQLESPPVFVHVSSVAAVGPAPRGAVRQLSHPPQPISRYGQSKYAGEARVTALSSRMPITVVRPGAVFGERDRGSLPIFKTIRQWRFHPVLGFRTPPLSVIHVTELVDILLRAADVGQRIPADPEDAEPGVGFYFACLNEFPTYAQVGRMVRRVMNYPYAPVLPLPKPVAWPVAFTNQTLSKFGMGIPLLNSDKLVEASAASWACDPRKTFEELKFEPRAPFEQRLGQTAAWYREAGWL